jgi:hypothetical protein
LVNSRLRRLGAPAGGDIDDGRKVSPELAVDALLDELDQLILEEIGGRGAFDRDALGVQPPGALDVLEQPRLQLGWVRARLNVRYVHFFRVVEEA